MRTGLYNLLASAAPITALVPAAKIYLTKLPSEYPIANLPAISFLLVTGSTELAYDRTEIRKALLQVDLWGPSPTALEAIEDAVHNALTGFAGTLSDGTRIIEIGASNCVDGFEVDSRIFRTILEFAIVFS